MCGIDCEVDPKGQEGRRRCFECLERRMCRLCLIVKLKANRESSRINKLKERNANHKPGVVFMVLCSFCWVSKSEIPSPKKIDRRKVLSRLSFIDNCKTRKTLSSLNPISSCPACHLQAFCPDNTSREVLLVRGLCLVTVNANILSLRPISSVFSKTSWGTV